MKGSGDLGDFWVKGDLLPKLLRDSINIELKTNK